LDHQYPEFAEAVQSGNDTFNPRIERSLAEQAIGFEVDMYDSVKDKSGEMKLEVTGRKYYPPNVTATIFFLKNRMPERWREVARRYITYNEFRYVAKLVFHLKWYLV
jgi:hypothetical protein